MAVSTELIGFEDTQKKLDGLGKKGINIANAALEKACQPILEEAKRRAPFRTGLTRSSIEIGKAAVMDGIRYRKVGIFKKKGYPFYAKYLEFGTRKMRARPFLSPAYEQKKKEAYKILKSEIKKGLGL